MGIFVCSTYVAASEHIRSAATSYLCPAAQPCPTETQDKDACE